MRARIHYSHVSKEPHPCPTCRAVLCQATNVEAEDASLPAPGTVVFCIECGHPAIFDERWRLRQLRAEELRASCQQPVFLRTHLSMAGKRRQYRAARGERES